MNLVSTLLQRQLALIGRSVRGGATESELRATEATLGFPIPDELKAFLRRQNGVVGPENIAGLDEMVPLYRDLQQMNPAAVALCPLQRNPYLEEIVAVDANGNLVLVNSAQQSDPLPDPLWKFLVTGAGVADLVSPESSPIGEAAKRAELAWDAVETWGKLLPNSGVQLGSPAQSADLETWGGPLPAVVGEVYRRHSSLTVRTSAMARVLLAPPVEGVLGRKWYHELEAAILTKRRYIGSQGEQADWWSDDWFTVRTQDSGDLYCVDGHSKFGRVLQIFHDDSNVPIVAPDLADFLAFTAWPQLLAAEETSRPVPG